MLAKKQCKITRRGSLKEEEAPGDMPHSGNERPRVKDMSVRMQEGNSPRTCRTEDPLAFHCCWQCGAQLEIVAEVSSGFKQR